MQSQRCIQRGLSAHCRQQHIRQFFFDNPGHHIRGYRLNIGRICHHWVCHNGGGIGINQNDPKAFFFQCLTGLRPGIIKLTCLSNNNRPCPNNQNGMNILTTWHVMHLTFWSVLLTFGRLGESNTSLALHSCPAALRASIRVANWSNK